MLELMIIVENVVDMLGIDKYEACKACETPLFVYDFAKHVETLSGGFSLRISDEELDKLNERAYRTSCEIAEEYKIEEIERVNCMSRENNEKIEKQREIARLCFGTGYKPGTLKKLDMFADGVIDTEWTTFTEHETWKPQSSRLSGRT